MIVAMVLTNKTVASHVRSLTSNVNQAVGVSYPAGAVMVGFDINKIPLNREINMDFNISGEPDCKDGSDEDPTVCRKFPSNHNFNPITESLTQ